MNQDLVIEVTLNTDLPGHCYLVVNNGRHLHEFSQHPEGQSICWTLAGNASHGEFCALDDSNPGFQWSVSRPPEGIFRSFSKPAPHQLRVMNHHTGNGSRGHWPYLLFARFGDRVYQTPWVATNGASNTANPTIRNT